MTYTSSKEPNEGMMFMSLWMQDQGKRSEKEGGFNSKGMMWTSPWVMRLREETRKRRLIQWHTHHRKSLKKEGIMFTLPQLWDLRRLFESLLLRFMALRWGLDKELYSNTNKHVIICDQYVISTHYLLVGNPCIIDTQQELGTTSVHKHNLQ